MIRMVIVVAGALCAGCVEGDRIDSTPSGLATDSAETAVPARSAPLETPDDPRPVLASVTLDPPSVSRGGIATVVVRVRLAPGWHIYGMEPSESPNLPTTLKLLLPDGVEVADEWSAPAAQVRMGASGLEHTYQNDVTFRRPIRILASASSGRLDATCGINYQACNRSRCLTPTSITAVLPITVAANKE